MPFLILTRAGFDDIVSQVNPVGAVLRLNPGVASDAQIEGLRDAGPSVHVLASTADPALQQTHEHSFREQTSEPSRWSNLLALYQRLESNEVSATSPQLILAPDSVCAASHAAAEGLIRVDRLDPVRLDKREDDAGDRRATR